MVALNIVERPIFGPAIHLFRGAGCHPCDYTTMESCTLRLCHNACVAAPYGTKLLTRAFGKKLVRMKSAPTYT